MDEAVALAKEVIAEMYPSLLENEQYTAMLNERHFQRMQKNIDDANERGAEIVAINPANEDFSVNPTQKIPPTKVTSTHVRDHLPRIILVRTVPRSIAFNSDI